MLVLEGPPFLSDLSNCALVSTTILNPFSNSTSAHGPAVMGRPAFLAE